MLGNFSFANFLQNELLFSKNSFRNTIRADAKSLDPDQDGHSVGPDLCPNCLQWLSESPKARKELNFRALLQVTINLNLPITNPFPYLYM